MWIVSRVCLPLMLVCLAACAGSPPPHPQAGRPKQDMPTGRQLLEIAEVLRADGDHVRAAQYLTLAQKRGVPEREVLPRLLALYAADSQYRVGIEQAEVYLRRHPSDVRVRQCLAGFYVAVGSSSDALRHFQLLLSAAPDNAEVHFALATLLLDLGTQRARADEHYRAYLALAPQGRHAEEARAGLLEELK